MAEISFAEERQVALWILRRGGQVMVDGVEHPIGDPFDLPDRDFRIVVVDLHGTVIEPRQLQEISKLEHVRELYVPARVWSPVSDVKAPLLRRIVPVLPGNEAAGDLQRRSDHAGLAGYRR